MPCPENCPHTSQAILITCCASWGRRRKRAPWTPPLASWRSTPGRFDRGGERESGVRLDPPSWPVSKDHRCPQGRLVAGCTKRCQNTSPNEHQNHVLHICGKNHARIVAGMNGRLYTPEDIAEHRSDLTAGQMSEHVRTLARKNFRTHSRTYPSRYAIDDA